jgi:Flp pilus assembly protein CpaB
LFALGAAAVTYFVANTAKSEAPAPIPTSTVVVAAREIPAKTEITAADLKLVKMNTEVVPPAALTRPEDAEGKITLTPISVGEPILPSKLGGANGSVFVVIPADALEENGNLKAGTPAYRAMSITVADAQAAGGNVQPGDYVDILFSFTFDPTKYLINPNPTRNGPDVSARIVLERVPILARNLSVYTIRTDAATAERIGYLQASGGVLQLLLRAAKDDRATGTTGATFRTVYPEVKIQIPEKISP